MSNFQFRRTVKLNRILIAFSLFVMCCTHAAGQEQKVTTKPAVDPMAKFAQFIEGEWKVTAQSGKSLFHTWHWGPGKHSIRRMTDGAGANGDPWREVQVMYWHPARKQVRMLGVSPFARGVFDGEIKFNGETAEGESVLYQTQRIRKMGLRWKFEGADKFHDTLLEATGPEGLQVLAEWDHFRVPARAEKRSFAVEGVSKLPTHLKVFEPLLGHTWEAKAKWAAGETIPIQTNFMWVPLADAIYASVMMPNSNGKPSHILDAYIYQHSGTNTLRCLALSQLGGVYEGNIDLIDGGAVQFHLKGFEGDKELSYVVRLDFEKDASVRSRISILKGRESTLILDVIHKKIQLKKE